MTFGSQLKLKLFFNERAVTQLPGQPNPYEFCVGCLRIELKSFRYERQDNNIKLNNQ